jgi:SCP-2 sterol transfer family
MIPGVQMPDPTSEFLEGLAERGRIPALQRTTGTLRLDVDRDGRADHWRLDIRRGTVAVARSEADAEADCVIAAPGALMDDLVTGRGNAMAATLRDELVLTGDPNVLVRFQRLFPNPTGRRTTAAARTVGKRRG